jgi:cytochrome P450 family 6
MLTEVLLALIAVLLVSIYLKFKKSFSFWKDRNVPFIPPIFPTGNILEIMKGKIHSGLVFQKFYNQMKHTGDYCGIYFFQDPALFVLSPEFAKTILVKDFNCFVNRGMYSNEKDDPLGANLFFLEGQRWRDLRAKLTPTFTSTKLKQMFFTVLDEGNKFVNYIQPLADSSEDIDVYDLLLRFNTDVISSCAYGFESNSLENPDTEFRTMGKRMLTFNGSKSLKILLASNFPNLGRALKIRFNDEDVAEFFLNIVKETIEYRERTGEQRKDFMQLLMNLMKKDESEEDKLTFYEIVRGCLLILETICSNFDSFQAAQAYVMYFAGKTTNKLLNLQFDSINFLQGFETSSTVNCFALHFLAHYQDIQEKARKHVSEVLEKHNNEWCYDAVMEMSYIDQIIEESMRIYPPVAALIRVADVDYQLPNGSTIFKGTKVIIPNLGFQRDPDIFPDPMKFDPDRFSPEMKQTRHSFSSLPFGEGLLLKIRLFAVSFKENSFLDRS